MKKILIILLVLLSVRTLAQLPYAWAYPTNPAWTSSAPSVNTLAFQTACYKVVSTSDCTGGGFWNTYNNNQITSYTSPVYDFSCGVNVVINIQLDVFLGDRTGNATTGTHYDWFYFQYSTDGGVTWINPVGLNTRVNGSGVNLSGFAPLTNWVNTNSNRNGYTGGNVGVINPSFSIPASATTKFRFIFESDGSVNTTGAAIYYVDILAFGATCAAPLPIELLSFNGEKLACNENIIRWSTATETNNDHFEIERSTDGINYNLIGTVNGAGNSTHTISYLFLDLNPLASVNYYRLKQIDFNGDNSTSSIISVDNSCIINLKVIKIINLLGQEVNSDYEGPRFVYYNNGTVIKKVGK